MEVAAAGVDGDDRSDQVAQLVGLMPRRSTAPAATPFADGRRPFTVRATQSCLVLPGAFLRLLPRAHLGEATRASRRRRPSGASSSPNGPAASSHPGGAHAEALGEQGDEDPRLLVAVAGQRLQPGEQLVAGVGVAPQRLGVAAVVLDEVRAHRLHALGHRTGEAVDRPRSLGDRRGTRRGPSPRSRRRRAARRAGPAAATGRGTPTPSAPAGRAASRRGARAGPC